MGDTVKIVSWNVNGIRASLKKGFDEWFKSSRYTVYCLQEVRAKESQFPKELQQLWEDYSTHFFSAEKKGYSGVGIISKQEPLKVIEGIGDVDFDSEGRVLTCEYEDTIVISAYFPNSQGGGARLPYKLRFCESMQEHLKTLKRKKKTIVLTGDYNIAHQAIDLARPESNEMSPGYFKEERDWMSEYLSSGWVDTFRELHPNTKDAYSWWSMRTRARERNVGWRIDYNCIDRDSIKRLKKAEIKMDTLGSDHCPVSVTLSGGL